MMLHKMLRAAIFSTAYFFLEAKTEIQLIKDIQVSANFLKIEVNDEFKKSYLRDDFFVRYDNEIDLSSVPRSLLVMPFILNVISIVWISGNDYYIDEMDKDLFLSLKKVKKVIQRLYPKTNWNGNLRPRKLISNKPLTETSGTHKSALLFSGGLDSTAAALPLKDQKMLLITVRGQWDIPLDRDELWQTRTEEFKEFADSYGHSNAYIYSNFSTFLKWEVLDSLSNEIASWRIDTVEGMGMLGLAAPLLYLKSCPLLRMAASYQWSYPWPSASNPFIDNNLIFAKKFHFRHEQFNLTRFDKVRLVTELVEKENIPVPKMKVCDGQRANHCMDNDCSKCIPLALTLVALQQDARKFGFSLTDDEIIEKARAYFKEKQLYWTLWELTFLQEYLRNAPSKDERLNWFIDLPLDAVVDSKFLKSKSVVDWKKFKDLCPKKLAIPDYELKFLDPAPCIKSPEFEACLKTCQMNYLTQSRIKGAMMGLSFADAIVRAVNQRIAFNVPVDKYIDSVEDFIYTDWAYDAANCRIAVASSNALYLRKFFELLVDGRLQKLNPGENAAQALKILQSEMPTVFESDVFAGLRGACFFEEKEKCESKMLLLLVIPLAVAYADDFKQLCECADALLTAFKASSSTKTIGIILAQAIACVINDHSLEEIIDKMMAIAKERERDGVIASRIEKVKEYSMTQHAAESLNISSYLENAAAINYQITEIETLEVLLSLFIKHETNFKLGMREATLIRNQNILVGPILGALIGARIGLWGLKKNAYAYELEMLEKINVLQGTCNDLYVMFLENENAKGSLCNK